MRRFILQSVLMLVSGILVSCASGQAEEKNPNSAATNWQATFVELGSVNCVPCRMMKPVMEQVEKEYPGVVKVVFYDVWTPKEQIKAREYNIRAIPTQVFLDKDGKEFFRHMGFFPFAEIEKILAAQGIEKPKAKAGNRDQGGS